MPDGVLPNFDNDLHPPPYSPLERAALAIFRNEYEDEISADGGLSEMGQFYWREKGPYFMAYARAVIEAIREPSEAVRKAMRQTIPVTGHDWEYNDSIVSAGVVIDDEPGDCWRAMIDALLEEGA